MGWVRSQHVVLMWSAGVKWCLGGNTLVSFSTKVHTQTWPHTVLCDANPHDLSQPANHIVVAEMTAEPLSLSWLVSVEINIQKYSDLLLQPRCNSSIHINSRWPLGSVFLSPHKTIKRPCDMTVITYWCFGEHSSVHLPLFHYSSHPSFSLKQFAVPTFLLRVQMQFCRFGLCSISKLSILYRNLLKASYCSCANVLVPGPRAQSQNMTGQNL